MKRLILTITLIIGLFVIPLGVQAVSDVFAIYGEPVYEGTISDTTSSVGFSSSYLSTTDGSGRTIFPKAALIVVETATITFTVAGTTPTIAAGTNVGIQLASGGSWVIRGANAVRNFRCINTVASSGAKLKYIIFINDLGEHK